jgi:hypothetical protein
MTLKEMMADKIVAILNDRDVSCTIENLNTLKLSAPKKKGLVLVITSDPKNKTEALDISMRQGSNEFPLDIPVGISIKVYEAFRKRLEAEKEEYDAKEYQRLTENF